MLTEQQLWDLKRGEQFKMLKGYGLSRKERDELNLEHERVAKLLELQKPEPEPITVSDGSKCIKCENILEYSSEGPDIINYKCPVCKAKRSINKSTL